MKDVPFVAVESASVMFNKANRRLIYLIVLLFVVLVVSNGLWVKYHLDTKYHKTHYHECPYYTQHGVVETEDD